MKDKLFGGRGYDKAWRELIDIVWNVEKLFP